MTRTIAQVEDELRRSRNSPFASTHSGRCRTEELQNELHRLRDAKVEYCKAQIRCCGEAECYQRGMSPCNEVAQLGRTIPQTDPTTQARMVREAMRRVCTEMYEADASNRCATAAIGFCQVIEYASDDALSKLYRMLKV